jgi:hypothetical protein
LVLLTRAAVAGAAIVRDNAHVIPKRQVDGILETQSRWRFNLKVLTGVFETRQSLNAQTGNCIRTPSDLCVGIDPKHHHVSVHFGTAVKPPSSEMDLIASAGNDSFADLDWQAGIVAIAERAERSIAAARPAPPVRVLANAPPPAPAPVVVTTHHGFADFVSSLLTWLFVIGIVVIIVVVSVFNPVDYVGRRSSRSYQSWGSSGSSTVNVNNSAPAVVYEREVIRDSSSASYDAGGGSSDWGASDSDDDDCSSSSSSDSGSSDW